MELVCLSLECSSLFQYLELRIHDIDSNKDSKREIRGFKQYLIDHINSNRIRETFCLTNKIDQ